jgi:metal transporter CNNM
MTYLIILVLVSLSGIFSGLTLGLMGLDLHALKRKARLDNKYALAILPIRERGNQLLTTLLLANVAVNSVLAIYLSSITNGIVAGIVVTALIFVFGEMLPQAIISRHAMRYGAHAAPAVWLLMKISSPITYPVSALLDKMLGAELPTLYTKREIMEIVSEHEDAGQNIIDGDEERIVHGALKFSQQTVQDVMTPRDEVITLHPDQILDEPLRRRVTEDGFSRYPVVDKSHQQIVGIFYTKDVIVADERATVNSICDHRHLAVRPQDTLDLVLAHMLKRRLHMAIVRDELNTFLGVITLEDIIEEVIQHEILDEDDDVGESRVVSH